MRGVFDGFGVLYHFAGMMGSHKSPVFFLFVNGRLNGTLVAQFLVRRSGLAQEGIHACSSLSKT
jgi:hypothetical protein